MDIIDILNKKRKGKKLTKEEILFFIDGITKGSVADYQASAMLMAICIQGMTDEETADLTHFMTYSGDVLDLSEIEGIKVDKHSTGGVADTTTLVLAPICAALGLNVIKMSGRGLGHTGGTIDKLESIPGYNVSLTKEEAIKQVKKHGIALFGQTSDLAPADKILYALRDVTGTVESIPLIASSIMSKKFAAGSDAIVLDIKVGSGAFMKNTKDAEKLAHIMIESGKRLGKKVTAVLTNMDAPLGDYIGNSLEVMESTKILKGEGKGSDLYEVSLTLATHMLLNGKIYQTPEEARENIVRVIEDGRAFSKFKELVRIQGGDERAIDDTSLLPLSKKVTTFKAERSGYIYSYDNLAIGRASCETGAGRKTKEDIVDPGAGIVMKKRVGDKVEMGETIALIYTEDRDRIRNCLEIMEEAVDIRDTKPEKKPLIYGIYDGEMFI